jgi:tRNA pseudouridine32 synthase/23S rRNA pseudouridine746 synthase
MTTGVGPSWVVLPQQGPWPTVLAFLQARFARIEADEWLQRMQLGLVCTEFGQSLAPDSLFAPGLRIRYFRRVTHEPRVPFEAQLLFEDELIVVADKPHFLPVTPSGRYVEETLLARLRRRLGLDTLVPVHRLDRDTAGLVLLCKPVSARDAYAGMFRARAASKVYEAVAPWRPALNLPLIHSSRLEAAPHFMQMHEIPGEPNAHTRISLVEHNPHWGRYRLEPLTGRRHQLRVHMAALGLPIRHDGIYPRLSPEPAAAETPDYSRPMQLLARELRFTDPVTGQARAFVSERNLEPLPTEPLKS